VDYRTGNKAQADWDIAYPRRMMKIDLPRPVIGSYKPPQTMNMETKFKVLESGSQPLHFHNLFAEQEPYQPGLTFSNQQKLTNTASVLNNEEEAFGLAVNFV
jgi:hypothetical protein